MKLTLDLTYLHDFQKDFLRCESNEILFSGGSGIGKSYVGVMKLIIASLSNKNYQSLYAAATWQSTETIFLPMLLKALKKLPGNYWDWNKGLRKFEFINGSEIHYRNLQDPESLRSMNLDLAVIEEATQVLNIENLHSELVRGIRNRKGLQQIIYITNPGLKTHWLYKHFYLENYGKAWSLPAIMGTHQTEEYFNNLKNLPQSKKLSLLAGEWGVMEGMAFPNLKVEEFDLEIPTYISFDYGFTDAMVYLLCGEHKGVYFVFDEITLQSCPINRHSQFLDPWMQEYNVVGFTGETATGAGEIRDLLIGNYKLKWYQTVKKRSEGWTKIADLLDLGNLVIHPRCKGLIESLESLAWASGTRGIDIVGENNHHSDACRYYLMSSCTKAKPARNIIPPKPQRMPQKISITLPSGLKSSIPNVLTPKAW